MESPLPTFGPGLDPGSSFVDLLRQVAPHDLPGAGLAGAGSAAVPIEITHGTTVVAIRYADGVVMAGDRRATAGYTIASRRIEKVFAGRRLLRRRHRRRGRARGRDGEALPGAARALREGRRARRSASRARPTSSARWCAATCPAAMQGFAVVPLFAGYDHRRERGRVFSYDVTGGKYEEPTSRPTARAACTPATGSRPAGSEGMTARRHRRPRDLRALFAAADEDAATGGPDLVRAHLPDGRGDRRRPATARSTTTTSSRASRGALRRPRSGEARL